MNEVPPTDGQVVVFLAAAVMLVWGLGEVAVWLVSHLPGV